MIVVYFHLPGSSVAPDEADSPLIVDANAVLSTICGKHHYGGSAAADVRPLSATGRHPPDSR